MDSAHFHAIAYSGLFIKIPWTYSNVSMLYIFYGRFYKFNLSLANSQNLIKATANVILLSQI